MLLSSAISLATASLAALATAHPQLNPRDGSNPPPVSSTSCNGKKYIYESLAGYGFIAASARDKYGDTMSIGSSIAISDWRQHRSGKYTGTFYGLPDRGWNTKGTLNYQPRIHKFKVTFDPTNTGPSTNLEFEYKDTILFTDPNGVPASGLDPDFTGGMEVEGFPTLPAVHYEGDGFGNGGPGGFRVCIDPEGLVLGSDGSFWISDEYGPYVYHFNSSGQMIDAIRPVEALIPYRNDTVSWSAASAPIYDEDREPIPEDPDHGRNNNQGFEGLTVSPDGKTLYVLLQSAAMQEGGTSSAKRKHARYLVYDISSSKHHKRSGHRSRDSSDPELKAEYVVELPTYVNAEGKSRVASQSEIHYVSPSQFLILPRDSDAGHGMELTESKYRHVDIFDIEHATNIKGKYDDAADSVESEEGVLTAGITPATLCSFVDFNINSELAKFSLHNGGENDAGLLNEKWEGLALLPVSGSNEEYFLFAASDNDFITENGFMNGGAMPYSEGLGVEVDHQTLVFKVKLPPGSKPLIG